MCKIIIGYFWFVVSVLAIMFFVGISIYIAIDEENMDAIIFMTPCILGALIMFYIHKTNFGHKIPLNRVKELKRLEKENILLQKRIELAKYQDS